MGYYIDFEKQFIEDLEFHRKAGLKSILAKIDALIDELQVHPTTGTGCPEQLKGELKGLWSRRITQKHRLIYEIREAVVTVILISAKGHYDDN